VTRRNSVGMSAGGDTTPTREKRGDDTNWADTNLTRPKNEKKSTQSIQLLQINGEGLKQ
jgi:hypothetical protein